MLCPFKLCEFKRRLRDSNPHVLSGHGFQDRCNTILHQDGKYIKTADEGLGPSPLESNSSVQPLHLSAIFPAMPFFALWNHRFAGLNAIPCSRVHCQTDTEWVEHPSSVLETDMLPLTPRAYIFYKHFFKVSINSFTCFCVYTTALPSSEDRTLIFPDFLSFSTISQASLPYSSQPQTFAYFLLDFFITIFLLSFNIQKC